MKSKNIQVFRAIAIILVLLQHLSFPSTVFQAIGHNIKMPFYLGVEIFFVISGYVVTLSYLRRHCTPISFLIRRVFRIFPALLFFLAISAIANALVNIYGNLWAVGYLGAEFRIFVDQALSILCGVLINMYPQTLYSNAAMWSLSVEFQFYAAYAFFIYLMGYFECSLKKISFFLLMLVLFVMCLIERSCNLLDLDPLNIFFIKYLVCYRFDFLISGSLAAFISEYYRNKKNVVCIRYVALFLLITPLILDGVSPILRLHANLILLLSLLMFSFLVLISDIFEWKCTHLIGRITLWIGDRSYAIYLLHFPIMMLVWLVLYLWVDFSFRSGAVYGLAQAILTLPITFLLADFCYRKIELPFIELGKSLVQQFYGLQISKDTH
jgi:peptidoglycan/LPS O-acetylase OafA/YrhL